MTVQDLPALNATLNASSAALLGAGWLAIRSGRVALHRALMATAFLISAVFLASYLAYHYSVGHVRFQGTGPVRGFYLALLLSHTVMAVLTVPMVLRTLFLAVNGRFEEHRQAARWAWPSWMYVSVTGVAVYLMLYRMRF